MKKYNVVALVGGISKASINKRLFNEVVRLNTQNIVFETFDISTLPFYRQDIENNYHPNVLKLKSMIKEADAILFITPEYNRTMPGVLKNAIDLASRPYGDNSFSNKPTAIMGASSGNLGTFGAQQHLRNCCSFLNMHMMSQPEFYFNASVYMNENGVTDESVDFLRGFLKSFEEWIDIFNNTKK